MKRFLLVVVSVFVLVIIGIITFIAVAGRDIPPPDTTDLLVQRSPVADQDNAYTYFIAATNSLYWPTNTSLVTDILGGKTNDDAFVSDLIVKNAETLRLVDQGLICNICQVPEVTDLCSLTPYVGKWRNIGRVMALKAMHERQMGQFAEAAQTCGKIIRFVNLIQKNAEDLVNYLSATAILMECSLEQTRQSVYASGTPAAQLVQLSETLGQLSPFDQGLIRVLKNEYQREAKKIDDLATGKCYLEDLGCYPLSSASHIKKTRCYTGYFFQPNKTKMTLANLCRDMIKDIPRVYADMKRYDVEKALNLKANKFLPNVVGKGIYAFFFSDPDILLEVKCRRECSIAATRLILACKAYENQHQELPPSLEALIPKHLDAVPRDPYDGKPFRYRRSEGIVYSVGKDLLDSNGSKDLLDNAPCSWIWYAKDIVFGINNTIEPTNLPHSQ